MFSCSRGASTGGRTPLPCRRQPLPQGPQHRDRAGAAGGGRGLEWVKCIAGDHRVFIPRRKRWSSLFAQDSEPTSRSITSR